MRPTASVQKGRLKRNIDHRSRWRRAGTGSLLGSAGPSLPQSSSEPAFATVLSRGASLRPIGRGLEAPPLIFIDYTGKSLQQALNARHGQLAAGYSYKYWNINSHWDYIDVICNKYYLLSTGCVTTVAIVMRVDDAVVFVHHVHVLLKLMIQYL